MSGEQKEKIKKYAVLICLYLSVWAFLFNIASCDSLGFVTVTGISLNKESTLIAAGESEQLVATIEPIDASNPDVTWATSDETKATVSSAGLVTGVAGGDAIITVTTNDGGKSAACTVTVVEDSYYAITYDGNENSSGEVPVDTSTYANGDTVTIADAGTLVRYGYTFSGWNTLANGNGDGYFPGSTLVMGDSDVILYADWTAISAVVPTNGLVAEYTFSGNAADSSGNGYDCAVIGAILTADRFENNAGAFYFDGEDDYLQTTFNPASVIGDNNPFTISVWLNPYNDWKSSLVGAYQSTSRFYIAISDGYYWGYGDTHSMQETDRLQVVLNEWQFVVLEYDGTDMLVYFNGYLADALTYNGDGNIFNEDICIGFFPASTNDNHFIGKIDDVRIYDRVLSDSEILDMYQEN